jgi:hypothetical protein
MDGLKEGLKEGRIEWTVDGKEEKERKAIACVIYVGERHQLSHDCLQGHFSAPRVRVFAALNGV